ncbi:MAG TPA: methyltransferase domain-containing protein [Thermoplasmata archaeon]|nr:methyltransferase domain-containing protein [Thermoplasmata archaeon]
MSTGTDGPVFARGFASARRAGTNGSGLARLAEILVCPCCDGDLRDSVEGMACPGEGTMFPIREGVLRLLVGDDQEEAAERGMAPAGAWSGGRPPRTLEEAAALPRSGAASRSLAWRARARCADSLLENLRGGSKRVADLGAGCGWFSRMLLAAGHSPIAVDLEVAPPVGIGTIPALGHSFAEIAPVLADMETLPFRPGSLDAAVAFGSLSYVRDPPRFLARLARALRPGGEFFAAMVPVHRDSRAAARAGQARTKKMGSGATQLSYRHFVEQELLDWFREAGFEPRIVEPSYDRAFLLSRAAKSVVLRSEVARFPLIIGRRTGGAGAGAR